MATKRLDTILHPFWMVIPALLLISMYGKIIDGNGLKNLYVYQAQAFLSGKLNIEEDINNLPGEVALSGGKIYNIFPPFPAILLLPFVAIFGAAGVKTSLIAFIISLLSCYLLYKILR